MIWDKHNWMINQIKSKLDLITNENKNKIEIETETETETVADNKISQMKNIVLEDM